MPVFKFIAIPKYPQTYDFAAYDFAAYYSRQQILTLSGYFTKLTIFKFQSFLQQNLQCPIRVVIMSVFFDIGKVCKYINNCSFHQNV